MFQREEHIAKLVTGFLKDGLSTLQQAELEAWLEDSTANRQWFEQLCREHTIQTELKVFESADSGKLWERTMAKLSAENVLGETGISPTRSETSTPVKRLWPKMAVAAAIAIAIFGAGLFFYQYQNKQDQNISQSKYANDINPGKQGATLTLANGKKIRLADVRNGELAKQAGITITKTADGQLIYEAQSSNTADENQINTFQTSKGETYSLKLPDGSTIWLNSESSVTYSANLYQEGKRRVNLTGEGYFQVAKDKNHPFIVNTNQQEVEVLGTEFNINSYPDEKAIATTLIEGSVKVKDNSTEKTATIKPGQQATTSQTGISIKSVETDNITDWKNGDFVLEGTDFKTAMRKIARWYDVEVVYDNNIPDTVIPGGWISRNSKLSTILTGIEEWGIVRCRIQGRTIHVSSIKN